ncbi:MAG: putative DNA binding domain-containing protein [Deltaproteobacteria bacterium]|nr:putative DNA binding domain-containing protein [Deltaproteobacteria bacterium]
MFDNKSLLELLEKFCQQECESELVEFKSNWERPEDIGAFISAMANAAVLAGKERAWMIWGVNNETHVVKGTSFKPFSAKGGGNQALIMWLSQMITPRPDFQFYDVQHRNGNVVMLEIHAPRSAPLAFDRCRYIRIDSHKTKLSEHPDKEARLWELLGTKVDWSGEIVPDATLSDLDPDAVLFAHEKFAEYRAKTEQDDKKREKIRAEVMGLDGITFLNQAHITKQGRITRSALLLLGRDEATHHLETASTKISWILRSEHNEVIGGEHFGTPLILATGALFNRIRNIALEYMPDGSLFPTPVSQYDPWVIREALHNCIAHQDYCLSGKINVVEYPDRLVFSNLGTFIPPSIEWMLQNQSPPEHYRNQWLIDGMIRLRMIDQLGSGIRRMFQTQRERFFPLPDYTIDPHSSGKPRVEVAIHGKILDVKYTQILMRRKNLELSQVILLDRIQKRQKITPKDIKQLRAEKLIEGRSPNYYISAKVAEWVNQKARYIRNRGLDDDYYQKLIVEYLKKYQKASREILDDLLLPKLSEVLTLTQKKHKIRNLIQSLRRTGTICNVGSKKMPTWVLSAEKNIAKQQ